MTDVSSKDSNESSDTSTPAHLIDKLDQAVGLLEAARDFAKAGKLPRVLDTCRRVLLHHDGLSVIEARAEALENAGVFLGSDWAAPQHLVAPLSRHALTGGVDILLIETLSDLRLLAVARGKYRHPLISAEYANQYLTQILAINLDLLFNPADEARRLHQGRLTFLPHALLEHLASHIGYEQIVDKLIGEIWRVLEQRPIQTGPAKQMITRIAACQYDPEIALTGAGADRLVSSLFGPTRASREDPGLEVYQERLATMDEMTLQTEASGFARSMHDTGLVSAYHTLLLLHLLEHQENLLADALGLSSTGRDCMLCYRQLVHALIHQAVTPQTPQSIYGLALMLERGILYQAPLAPALWRQLRLQLCPEAINRLALVSLPDVPAETRLMEGVLCMLGQPLGVGQGNNPTCQSARALSMWSCNDPDYLLQMVAWAARDDEIIMHFEGQPVSSRLAGTGVALAAPIDLDPVSMVVVPHLDRIYAEMGRLCIGRVGDPHRWINPEFHGWWTGRGFRIGVDVQTGLLLETETFLRHFYASYHPFYNGNQPLIHPQPAGIAVTDSAARFIGWHAVTILRVGLDQESVMRVYFYNPNNDSGQDWGNGVVVSTAGQGERYGEASLPFEEFASRLYIFHYDPLEHGVLAAISAEELHRVIAMIQGSWGESRLPETPMQMLPD
ncbi:hypothetical protein [Alcanivorax sp. 1008]|uniref:hypothetical protein n=1 Tax=Alcanivorax sp. 1008 TaxID=2816853 RepID=UPI001DFE67A3|nr:hypothetical protein [Alcanivorax sp. 1008]MCC1497615.1 hypothetical protein [Alcanivorax sp. 1008]